MNAATIARYASAVGLPASLTELVVHLTDGSASLGDWVQTFVLLVLGLYFWLPDKDGNRVPDFIDRASPKVSAWLIHYVVPLLLAAAAALGVSQLGCGGSLSVDPQPPGYSLSDDPADEDAVPDRAEFTWPVLLAEQYVATLSYVQILGDPWPATGCLTLATLDGVVLDRVCGSCEWAEGVSACRLLPRPGLGEGTGQ